MKNPIWVFFMGLSLTTASSQEPMVLKHFFGTPLDTSNIQAFQLNINSISFSGDTFLYYQQLVDTEYRKRLASVDRPTQAQKEEWNDILGRNLMHLAFYYQRKAWDNNKALDTYTEAISFLKKTHNPHYLAMSLNAIATIYESLGAVEPALSYYLEALSVLEAADEKPGLIITLSCLGDIYYVYHDTIKALECCHRAIHLCRETKLHFHTPYILLTLAAIHGDKGRFAEAEQELHEALDHAVDSSNILQQSLIHQQFGVLATLQGQADLAFKEFTTSLHLAKDITYLPGIAEGHLHLSKWHENKQDLPKALEEAAHSLEAAQKSRYMKIEQEVTLWLSELHAQNGADKEALLYYKLSAALKDSLFNTVNERALATKQLQYEFEKEEAIQNIEITQQRKQKVLYLAIGLLCLLLAIVLFNRLRFVRKANIEINKQREIAEQSEKFKTRLYANITHEFRTPLTLILGMAEQMETNTALSIQNGRQIIQRQGSKLLTLINQILDLSKLESNQMKLSLANGDLVVCIEKIVSAFIPFAESKEIQLALQTDLTTLHVNFDEEKMSSILENLLSNAIKFTSPGGSVNVCLSVESNDVSPGSGQSVTDKRIHMLVKDTGEGIPEGDIARIFDRFYQVENPSSKQGKGTGIGLTLVQELVRLMNGSIHVESKLQQGTEINVVLPFTTGANINQVNTSQSGIPFSLEYTPLAGAFVQEEPMTTNDLVLVIEDNQDMHEYLRICLEHMYVVKSAFDGTQGINMALEHVPDIVICDVMMPGKDGFEVCHTLKNDPRTSHIPIILLTAKTALKDKLSGLQQKADVYMTKPFIREELLLQMNNLISLRKNLHTRYTQLMEHPGGNMENPQYILEDSFITQINLVMESRMDEPDFSIDWLCRELLMSRTQLHRKLKALTNFSASHYIRKIRLQKALILLQTTNLNVSEVAYRVGFEDPKYFSRVFIEEYGKPPSAFRLENNKDHH